MKNLQDWKKLSKNEIQTIIDRYVNLEMPLNKAGEILSMVVLKNKSFV